MGRALPWFSVGAFGPVVAVVLLWATLELWAEPLGYAAPAVVALAFVLSILLSLGGILAAGFGVMVGERPRAVALVAGAANLLALAWSVGFFR